MENRILEKISSLICLVPLISAFINLRYIKRYLVPLFLYVIAATITEFFVYLHVKSGTSNFYLFRAFTLIEFTLVSTVYIIFFEKFFKPFVFYFIIFLFYLTSFFDYKLNGLSVLDDLSSSFGALIFTCYSLFLFYFILKNLVFDNLLQSPIFWINSAILLYFAGNLFLFAFSNFLQSYYHHERNILWATVHSLFNITFNILLGISFWKSRIT
jgi:hypothetical protein